MLSSSPHKGRRGSPRPSPSSFLVHSPGLLEGKQPLDLSGRYPSPQSHGILRSLLGGRRKEGLAGSGGVQGSKCLWPKATSADSLGPLHVFVFGLKLKRAFFSATTSFFGPFHHPTEKPIPISTHPPHFSSPPLVPTSPLSISNNLPCQHFT